MCFSMSLSPPGFLQLQSYRLFTPGVGFENRVTHGDGDYLTITSVVFNDNGWFECHCGKTQGDVQLAVLVPIVLGKPAYVGSNCQLHCYSLTEKQTPDSEVHVFWEKDGQTVLNVTAGNISYGSGFENRVSVSNDAYRQGDMSLTINNLQLSDQGLYQCSHSTDKQTRGNPDSLTLNVTTRENCSEDTGTRSLWINMVLAFAVVGCVSFLTGRMGPQLSRTNCSGTIFGRTPRESPQPSKVSQESSDGHSDERVTMCPEREKETREVNGSSTIIEMEELH